MVSVPRPPSTSSASGFPGDEGIVVGGAEKFFNVNETVAAGIAPAATVGDGGDVIAFGDGTQVYGDAFCGIGVGDGIHVDFVAAVQRVAAGTAVQGMSSPSSPFNVSLPAPPSSLLAVVSGQGVPVSGADDVNEGTEFDLVDRRHEPPLLALIKSLSKFPVPCIQVDGYTGIGTRVGQGIYAIPAVQGVGAASPSMTLSPVSPVRMSSCLQSR